jgi:hypothetical protein
MIYGRPALLVLIASILPRIENKTYFNDKNEKFQNYLKISLLVPPPPSQQALEWTSKETRHDIVSTLRAVVNNLFTRL